MLIKYAIKEFLDDRSFKNLSFYTIKMYKQNLLQFELFCVSNLEIIDTEQITARSIKLYLLSFKEKNRKVSTINNKIRSIKAFFNYLKDEELIKSLPYDRLKQSKEITRIRVPTDEEVKKLVDYYVYKGYRNGDFLSSRNRLLILLVVGTGIRRRELVDIRWSDIDFQAKSIQIFGKKQQIESVPIANKLEKELAEYRIFCDYKELKSEYLFSTLAGNKLSDEAISCLFKKLNKKMDFDYSLSCHKLRHFFCYKLIRSGMSTYSVQKLMRHTNIAMTERYGRMWGNDLVEENEKHSPLNTIDI
ncbi:tyrosine-type recombinase/integrase [Alkalicoccobacillus gibsonii]|uniref:tyrosine-type recombinase/integrase n=1 Tax=Alkalicoccobacillus gibsonii TaxID=79881 RepID=UPI001931658F|nr:tyrosine-type recombinase/integrase [Alkalicoccobacillus gibsonii]MBM0064754.1 tyrosine-type recombinase/integrase [Alkalicoccobacillus gibsonii]